MLLLNESKGKWSFDEVKNLILSAFSDVSNNFLRSDIGFDSFYIEGGMRRGFYLY